MGSTAQRTVSGYDGIPALLPLETIAPRMYIRPFLLFQLGEDYDIDRITSVVSDAYRATRARVPILDCKIVPDTEAKQQGVAKLQRLDEDEIPRVIFKDLRSSEEFSLTCAELKDKQFPPTCFDGDLLSPLPGVPAPGTVVAVAALQVNFIQGGMILCLALHHIPGDARTFLEWTKMLAEECRRAQGIDIPEGTGFDAAQIEDRERLRRQLSSGDITGDLANHPEYIVLPFVPEGNGGSGLIPMTSFARAFYLSPASLVALKADAAPANASTQPDDVPWISTFDALAALLWRTCVRAQCTLDGLEGDPASYMSFPIDNRMRSGLEPPAHPRTLGNFFSIADTSAPAREVLTTAGVADLAAHIRRSIMRKEGGRHHDSLSRVVLGLDHVEKLVPTLVTSLKWSAMITTWADVDYYGVEWGPLFGDRVEAVRFPGRGIMNTVLPRLPDGGVEVLLTMEPEAHEAILRDPVWSKYAQLRG